jgi:hypothetical protein
MTPSRDFSLATLHEMLQRCQQALNSPTGARQGGPAHAFLPAGDHTIRWTVDPTNAWIREVTVHQAGRLSTLCPARMQAQGPEGSYPACEVCAMAQAQDDWKLKAQVCCMTYGLVLASSAVHPYWRLTSRCLRPCSTRQCLGMPPKSLCREDWQGMSRSHRCGTRVCPRSR